MRTQALAIDCTDILDSGFVDIRALGQNTRLFYFMTFVDDQLSEPYFEGLGDRDRLNWLSGSVLGANRERISALCALPHDFPEQEPTVENRLAPGRHRVRMVGYLPDGTEYSTREQEVTHECPPAAPDADLTPSDPSPSQEAAIGAISNDVTATGPIRANGCAMAPGSATSPWLWLYALFILLAARRPD